MKYLNVQLFLVLLLLVTACGKSGSPSSGGSTSSGSGTVSPIEPKPVDETDPLYVCYKNWQETKEEMLENKTVKDTQASQWALGFTASECLKVSDLGTLKKVYDVYSKVNPLDMKATDWNKAISDVNLKGK